MEKKPQIASTYDEMFSTGGFAGVFDLPYRRSPYFPLFKAVRQAVARRPVAQVLEVGCGTGAMAQYLFDTNSMQSYLGFDFSPVAVEKARLRTGKTGSFFVGDATQESSYAAHDYDTLICTEVLEHIEDDLLAISHWKEGAYCVCSVPNYDADTHVRYFRDEAAVRARYGALVNIETITRRHKPFLDDRSIANWLRAVRWNRFRPDRLKWLLGFSNFDRDGGWFIFTGKRSAQRSA
ncbi:MAG: methyltransferase domain-containing protein [Rubrivivax sp.]